MLFLLISIRIHAQDLIPYLSHGKYGYADARGQIRIEPIYDEVEFFNQFEIARARLDTQWLLINKMGVHLLALGTNGYSAYQGLSARGYIKYGSRENVDTIPGLVRLELFTADSRLYIHTQTGKVSPLFSDFSRFKLERGMLTGFEGILRNGLYIGQTGINEYKVMNSTADIIATSNKRPVILNDSLLAYFKDDISFILNFKTNTTFSLPFYTTTACIDGSKFIVSEFKEDADDLSLRPCTLPFGVVDRSGKILVQPQYDEITPFGVGLLRTKTDDVCFLMTTEGVRIDSKEYLRIYETEGDYYQAEIQQGKWVFLDATGKQMLYKCFDKIEFNTNYDCYLVKSDSVSTILGENLIHVISYKADEIFPSEKEGYYFISIRQKLGILDKQGNIIIPPEFDWCSMHPRFEYVIIQLAGLKGLYDLSGNLLLNPEYEDLNIESFRNQPYIRAKKGGEYTYFDPQLNQLSEFQPTLHYLYDDGDPIRWNRDESDSIQLFTRFGQPLGFTVKEFHDGYVLSDSTYLMLVQKNDTTFLLYESEGNIKIDTFHINEDNSFSLELGLFGIEENGKEGVRHFRGQWIVPLAQQRITFISTQLIIAQKGNQYWFYTPEGKSIDSIQADWFQPEAYTSAWAFKAHQKTGFISPHTGKVIVPPVYDFGFLHSSECIEVRTKLKGENPKTLILDTLGQVMLKTRYDDLIPVSWDKIYCFIARRNGKAGLIDMNGKVCIPLDYKYVTSFADSTFFIAGKEDKSRVIFNRDWKIAFSGATIPVGIDSIKGPDQKHYYYHEYDLLPGHKYLFHYKTHSLVVDALGHTLKRIESANIKIVERGFQRKLFLEVTKDSQTYLIDTETLISFREEGDG